MWLLGVIIKNDRGGLSLQKSWLVTRKKHLNQIKQQVEVHLGGLDTSMHSYQKSFEREFLGSWRESSFKRLYNAIANTQLVFGSDFHAFSQSQRTHLRILREIVGDRSVVLCLECVQAKDQEVVDEYLQGEITEKSFLKKVRWNEDWGFPWSYYKQLFEFAKNNQIKVQAINLHLPDFDEPSLHQRDEYVAEKICKVQTVIKADLYYVIFGEMHLAKSHLPSFFDHQKPVIVFQNAERLYFKLAENSRESTVDVMESNHNRFCVMTSPPWVQWQNYLIFLEENVDYSLDEDESDMDVFDYMRNQMNIINHDLNIHSNIDEVKVITPDLELFEWLTGISEENKKTLSYLISIDRSFYLPEKNIVYLSRVSTNHTAEMCGAVIQAKLSGRKKMVWQMPDNYIGQVWLEAISFFVSKLINHKRKASHIHDLKRKLAVMHPKDGGREVLLHALDQRLGEALIKLGHKQTQNRIQLKKPMLYYESARIVGQMLGDTIYNTYRAGRLSNEDIIGYLELNIFKKDFFARYYEIVCFLGDNENKSPFDGLV